MASARPQPVAMARIVNRKLIATVVPFTTPVRVNAIVSAAIAATAAAIRHIRCETRFVISDIMSAQPREPSRKLIVPCSCPTFYYAVLMRAGNSSPGGYIWRAQPASTLYRGRSPERKDSETTGHVADDTCRRRFGFRTRETIWGVRLSYMQRYSEGEAAPESGLDEHYSVSIL